MKSSSVHDFLRNLWNSNEVTVVSMFDHSSDSLFLTSQPPLLLTKHKFLASASPRPPEVDSVAVSVSAAVTMFGGGGPAASGLLLSTSVNSSGLWTSHSPNVIVIGIACALYALALLTLLGNAIVIHAIRTERKLRTVSSSFIIFRCIDILSLMLLFANLNRCSAFESKSFLFVSKVSINFGLFLEINNLSESK